VTSVQNPSWRHHHAPQFYLAKWVDPATGKLCLCRRVPTGKLVDGTTHPKSTGFEEHLYSAPPTTPYEHWAPDIIETKFMSPLDNAASPVLEKLLAQPAGAASLDEADRKAWARFLRSLMERHPRTLRERDAAANQIAQNLIAEYKTRFTTASARRAFEIFDHRVAAKNIVRTHMVQQIDEPEFLSALTAQEWVTVETNGADFITSDQPLLENPGLDDTATGQTVYVMTLPLSPSRLFVSYPRSWRGDNDWQDVMRVITSEVHNMLVVSAGPQYLYSAKPIEDGKLVKLRKMVEESFGITAPEEEPGIRP